jgi:flagellar hook assembly protein FlgD
VTVISYELPAGDVKVALDIFDLRGRHVRNLVDAVQSGGLKSVAWNGTDTQGRRAASGVYFYTLKTGTQTLVRKMAIIK